MPDGFEDRPTSPGEGLRYYGQLVGTADGYRCAGDAADALVNHLDGTVGGEIWVKREYRRDRDAFLWVAYVDGYRIDWNPTIMSGASIKMVGPGTEDTNGPS